MTPERLELIYEPNSVVYDDIVLSKQKILDDIYKDSDIFEILNTTELQKRNAPPEDYYNVSIFSFLKIPQAQSVVKNFLCFEVNNVEEVHSNSSMIRKRVVFRTISHQEQVDTPYGIDRQDLLALLIKERFNWSNVLGTQLRKVYDSGKVAESGYYYRDIYFEQVVVNGLQKSEMQNRLDIVGRDYYDSRREI